MTHQEKLKRLAEHLACKAAGFAGVLPNGNVVDRRNHPDAIPMAANPALGIPEPTRCFLVQCRSLRLVWGNTPDCAGQIECDECGKLQPRQAPKGGTAAITEWNESPQP